MSPVNQSPCHHNTRRSRSPDGGAEDPWGPGHVADAPAWQDSWPTPSWALKGQWQFAQRLADQAAQEKKAAEVHAEASREETATLAQELAEQERLAEEAAERLRRTRERAAAAAAELRRAQETAAACAQSASGRNHKVAAMEEEVRCAEQRASAEEQRPAEESWEAADDRPGSESSAWSAVPPPVAGAYDT